jgi:rapamycin-insensitive companion of mTOR
MVKNQFSNDGETVGENPSIARDESTFSSTSDLSASNKRVRKKTVTSNVESTNLGTETAVVAPSVASSATTIAKHNRNECLNCSRSRIISKIADMSSLTIQEPKDLATQNSKIRESDVSFYSPESIISDDSANTNMPDRISNTILRNVVKMANPIMFKACRKILMELKQKYPQSFQDICLYSEICKHMSSCSYRMTVRRFIQEIFLDLNFDSFSNGVDLILEVAQQRANDQSLLDTSKMLPSSPPPQSSSTAPYSATSAPIPMHKLHSLKSPLLASVYETSVENLVDSPPKTTKDEVDSMVKLRVAEKGRVSPSESTKVTVEVHHALNRHSMESGEVLEPVRRRRFNTLELDLSCMKNNFPIKHRSPPSLSGPSATSTLRRPASLSIRDQSTMQKSSISTSDHSFEASTRKKIYSPATTPLGTLFCEQRLLTSRSEATLSNRKSEGKKDDETVEKK